MWLMKMSYRWFLFQCQPPVPRGFLFTPSLKKNPLTLGNETNHLIGSDRAAALLLP